MRSVSFFSHDLSLTHLENGVGVKCVPDAPDVAPGKDGQVVPVPVVQLLDLPPVDPLAPAVALLRVVLPPERDNGQLLASKSTL